MSEPQYHQDWIGQVFRGEATSGPKLVLSAEMAAQLVELIPGSMTFVALSAASKGARVLRIDGRLPGETGYPLQ